MNGGGHLWREGIPYTLLSIDGVNHPNGVGMGFSLTPSALFSTLAKSMRNNESQQKADYASSISAGAFFDVLPQLHGDGVTDDTAAIQARLDTGASCVYLPPPVRNYRISKSLEIGSGQELKLDRFSIIRLAPKSDCPMIENRCYRTGSDRNIAMTGGIWDMDNVNQSPNAMQVPAMRAKRPKKHDPGWFFGMAMRFANVEGMTVKGVTIRNPTTYGMAFAKTSYFVIDDISFDYRKWNPIPLNMDGVHLDGFCHHGKISNLRGTCFDDLVALNANDGHCAPEEGPISDIDIDGLYADFCHSAVRMLSAGADLKRVTVRNVHGNFYTYCIGLTHYFPEKPRGRFDDIVLSDLFAAKAVTPEETGGGGFRGAMDIIHVQGPVDIGNLSIARLYREEKTLPAVTIGIDPEATVENLAVRDCRMTNRLNTPIKFINNRNKIAKVVLDNNVFIGNWTDRGET